MSLLKIMIYPDPVLKEKCTPVQRFDAQLGKLLDDMFETMYAGNGIGLAGPQVGVTQRILVTDVSFAGEEKLELINPEIVETEGSTTYEEGCLSIPGFRETVSRKAKIKVKAQNRKGEEFLVEADDLKSICIQHEMDHLDGYLFVDRLSRLKRELFKSWLKKNAPLDAEE